ncbi:hypothetical protein [Maritalea sp.]|uniref:hypothetical protein n=1 Tax=Maritalea sp. TaxID=2003361 RepID=UPI003EF788EA
MPRRIPIGTTIFCPDTYSPMLTTADVSNPTLVTCLKTRIVDLDVHHSKLLDHFANMNRDYMGRYFDEEVGFLDLSTGCFQEVFVDLEPLEDAPIEWWRDNFSAVVAQRPVERLRCEARPRWRALGSIYFACYPWARSQVILEAANDNRAPKNA